MKVAIIGGAPSSRDLAPLNDPEWKIWVLGSRIDLYDKVDCIFEIHDDADRLGQGYLDKLIANGAPIYVGRNSPVKCGHILVFPFRSVEKLIGKEYLTSSLAYMIAMAILDEAEEIAIYGADMSVDDAEYFAQRPCMEFWIGLAQGRGIKITLPDVCPMVKAEWTYGCKVRTKKVNHSAFSEQGIMQLAEKHAIRIQQINAQIEHLERQINTHDGSRQAYEHMAKTARAIEAGHDIQSLTHAVELK